MLHIVGTPIGNLDDLSRRQIETIRTSPIILAESTSSAGILLQHIRQDAPTVPDQRVIHFSKDTEYQKMPEVMDMLRDGDELCMISEAGMPLISDPGYLLVKTMIAEDLPFDVIPGPTASSTALIYSGFNPKEHMALGFLPKRPSQLKASIRDMKTIKEIKPDMVFVFYEAPHRIQETLTAFRDEWADARMCICRELTKKFEEVVRGSPDVLLTQTYKGELTVVVA